MRKMTKTDIEQRAEEFLAQMPNNFNSICFEEKAEKELIRHEDERGDWHFWKGHFRLFLQGSSTGLTADEVAEEWRCAQLFFELFGSQLEAILKDKFSPTTEELKELGFKDDMTSTDFIKKCQGGTITFKSSDNTFRLFIGGFHETPHTVLNVESFEDLNVLMKLLGPFKK